MKRILCAIFLTGCSFSKPNHNPTHSGSRLHREHVFKATRADDLRPRVIDVASPSHYSGVRRGERLSVYQLGRTLSANHRRMHEAHPVYQVEQSNRWFLASRQELQPDDPATTDLPTKTPISNEEIAAEVAHQQAITRQLEAMETQLSQWHAEMKALLETERARLLDAQPATAVVPGIEEEPTVNRRPADDEN